MASGGNVQFLNAVDEYVPSVPAASRESSTDGPANRSLSPRHRPLTKGKTLANVTNLINKYSAQAPNNEPKFLIDPRTSKFITRWDGITAVALIFTAICTPYEVAFIPASKYPWDGWFIINRIIDIIFITDFGIQVRLIACHLRPQLSCVPPALRLGC